MSEDVTPERYRENLEVALTTLVTVCKRWPDAPLVVRRAVDVGTHVLCNGYQPSVSQTPVVGSRYMTATAKALELASWERAKAERLSAPPSGFVGGHGYPDPEIYSWCDKLNALHRVCTLQSCAGHVCTPESHCDYCAEALGVGVNYISAEQRHVMNGQLWLWLDEKLSRYVYDNTRFLAALPGVEKVSMLWHVEGREILDIVFRGAGTGELDTSMKGIMLFFEEASWRCNLD